MVWAWEPRTSGVDEDKNNEREGAKGSQSQKFEKKERERRKEKKEKKTFRRLDLTIRNIRNTIRNTETINSQRQRAFPCIPFNFRIKIREIRQIASWTPESEQLIE